MMIDWRGKKGRTEHRTHTTRRRHQISYSTSSTLSRGVVRLWELVVFWSSRQNSSGASQAVNRKMSCARARPITSDDTSDHTRRAYLLVQYFLVPRVSYVLTVRTDDVAQTHGQNRDIPTNRQFHSRRDIPNLRTSFPISNTTHNTTQHSKP
jgi:hypothetical protein